MCPDPWLKYNPKTHLYDKIPCHGCMSCRQDNLLLWQSRVNSEWLKYRSSFVTFTYDDNHLHYIHDKAVFPSVCKKDLTNYLDNVRHKVKKIFQNPLIDKSTLERCTPHYKYLAVSEYGDSFSRPHYHVLFTGLDFAVFKKIFDETWKNGSIKSLPLLSGGVRYVVDYVISNETGKLADKLYTENYRDKPFMLCSNGIGDDFFSEHQKEISETGNIRIGSKNVPVPLYFKNKYSSFSVDDAFTRNQTKYELIKKKRKEISDLYNSPWSRDLELRNSLNKELSLVSSALSHGKLVTDENFIRVNPSFDTKNYYKLAVEAIRS